MKSFKLVSWLNHIELLLQSIKNKIQIFMFSMIVLLMLMQRSWMLFWALVEKQMSMKKMMMISTLKIVMEPMTIQLIKKKKKKILNNQNTKV